MQLNIDSGLTDFHGSADWRITLEINPEARSARLTWSPEGLSDPGILGISITRHPLTEKQIGKMSRAVAKFEGLDAIFDNSAWVYHHGRDCWDYEDSDDRDAATEELRELLEEIAWP